MCVVDVGANIGFHALHAAILVGASGHVIASEPAPANCRLLRLSRAANPPMPQLEVLEYALADRDGVVALSDLAMRNNSGGYATHADPELLRRIAPGARIQSVPARRWDDHFAGVAIDIVKIDIEGAEPGALRGMTQSIERYRPTIISELHPPALMNVSGVTPAEYLRFFRERDYQLEIFCQDGTAATVPGDWERVAAEGGADLLLKPF